MRLGPPPTGPADHRARHGRNRAAAAAVGALAAWLVLLSGVAGASGGVPGRRTAAEGKATATYWREHPCDLIPDSVLEKVMKLTSPRNDSLDFGECEVSSEPNAIAGVSWSFQPGDTPAGDKAGNAAEHLPGKYFPEPRLGVGSWCFQLKATPPSSQVYIDYWAGSGATIDLVIHSVPPAKVKASCPVAETLGLYSQAHIS